MIELADVKLDWENLGKGYRPPDFLLPVDVTINDDWKYWKNNDSTLVFQIPDNLTEDKLYEILTWLANAHPDEVAWENIHGRKIWRLWWD